MEIIMTSIRRTLVGLATVAALAAGGAVYAAQPEAPVGPGACPYGGPGMGYGPGAGYGRGQGYGPGYGRGAMGPGPGYGRGMMGAGPGYGRGGPGAWGPGQGPGRGAGFSPAAMVDGRLAALKTDLGITADQETAWQAFTAKAKAQVETMQAQRTAMFAGAQTTAPERIAQRAAFAKQRAANLDTMSAAVKDLYEALTLEQKAVADQRLAFGGMGGPGGFGSPRGWR
jgi:hypothetical protein